MRLEHPQQLIDSIQYHNPEGGGNIFRLPNIALSQQVKGRGVYSFCMCPGGFVVPAASGPEQIVVNGMSPSNRGSVWANSGMVVELQPEDFGARFSMFGVLAGIKFQEDSERQCYLNGNCKQTAPAQRMTDFVNRRNSFDLPRSSYSRTHCFAVAFLVARFYRLPVAGRIQIFWERISWIPHPGSRDDEGWKLAPLLLYEYHVIESR